MDFSVISAGPVEASSATAIHISFSAASGDFLTTAIPSSARQIATSFQEQFVCRNQPLHFIDQWSDCSRLARRTRRSHIEDEDS